MGYDIVSFEQNIGSIIPSSGALGGHKYGVFECVQDVVGYTDLYYISDDPELYQDLFAMVGRVNYQIFNVGKRMERITHDV